MGQGLQPTVLTDTVIEAINEEFAYQTKQWPNPEEDDRTSVGNRLVTLRVYLEEAEKAFVKNRGDEPALDTLRKVAAIALRPLIEHGCPRRIG